MSDNGKPDESESASFSYWGSWGRACLWVVVRLLVVAIAVVILLALLGPIIARTFSNGVFAPYP